MGTPAGANSVVRAAAAVFGPREARLKRKRAELDEQALKPPLATVLRIKSAHQAWQRQRDALEAAFRADLTQAGILSPEGKEAPGREGEYAQRLAAHSTMLQEREAQADTQTFAWHLTKSSMSTTSVPLSEAWAYLQAHEELEQEEIALEQDCAAAAQAALTKFQDRPLVTPRGQTGPSTRPPTPGTYDELVALVRAEEAAKRKVEVRVLEDAVAPDKLRVFYDLAGGDDKMKQDLPAVKNALAKAFEIATPAPPGTKRSLFHTPPERQSPVRSPARSPVKQPPGPPPGPPPDASAEAPAMDALLAEFDPSIVHNLTQTLSFVARITHSFHQDPTGIQMADDVLKFAKRDALASGFKFLERLDKLQEKCWVHSKRATNAADIHKYIKQARFWEDQHNRWKAFTTPTLFPLLKQVLYSLERCRRTETFVPDVGQLAEYRRMMALHDATATRVLPTSYPGPSAPPAGLAPPPPPQSDASRPADGQRDWPPLRAKARELQLPFWNGNHCLNCNGPHGLMRCPTLSASSRDALRPLAGTRGSS